MNTAAAVVTPLVFIATLGILGAVYYTNKNKTRRKFSFPARDTAFDTAKTEFRSIKKPVTRQDVVDLLVQKIENPYGIGGTRRKRKKRKNILFL